MSWNVKVQLEPDLVLDTLCEPSYVNEVKSHILRAKVIWCQVVRCFIIG